MRHCKSIFYCLIKLCCLPLFAAVEEPMLRGSVFDRSGMPVKNADICLYPADYERGQDVQNHRFPRGASRCRKTEKDGTYSLYLPDRSPYVLIAGKKDRWTMRRIVPDAVTDTIVTLDTLKPTGNLTFTVAAEQLNNHRSRIALLGSPFGTESDSAGTVQLTNLPAGTYSAIIHSLNSGYRAVRCSLQISSGAKDQFSGTLVIPREQVAFVPTKEKMIAVLQDTVPVAPVRINTIPERTIPALSPVVKEPPKQRLPPTAKAPADTFIGLFEPLTLTGTGTVDSGEITMAWDIGATGRYLTTPSGTVELPAFKSPVNRLCCIFSVSDRFGARTSDTTYIYAGLLWISISPPRELLGRNGHSMLQFNNELFIIGGNRNDVWSSVDGVYWVQLTAIAPFGKISGHTTVVFNGKLWILGGKTGNTFNQTVWSSQNGATWRNESTAPFRRTYHSTVVFNKQLYLIGGISDSEDEPFRNDVWTSANGTTWNMVAGNAPFEQRYGHGCTVLNNRLVVSGGFEDAVGKRISYGDMWETTDGTTWKQITASAPFNREVYHSLLTFDGRLWAIGGYGRNGNDDYFSDVLFTYDGINWVSCTPQSSTSDRFFCTAALFNNRIIVSPSDSHKLWIMR